MVFERDVEDGLAPGGGVGVDAAEAALRVVAAWIGRALGLSGPVPTGQEAADRGAGPHLNMAWDWPDRPTPTILLEGGPYDWAIEVSCDPRAVHEFAAVGVFAEPYAGYALCLYPMEVA